MVARVRTVAFHGVEVIEIEAQVTIIFVGSFLLRPLVMRPVSLVWARIIESEKPVFTVMFGGAAAFATAIGEAAKHL